MKEVMFIHNLTGKEIFIKCDNVQTIPIDDKILFACTIVGDAGKFDNTVAVFSVEHYSMIVKKSISKEEKE